jgi:hypothetical protein
MILKKKKHYKKTHVRGGKKEWDCTRHKAKQVNPTVNEISNTNEQR